MKQRNNTVKNEKRESKEKKPVIEPDENDENQGFSNWLRSSDGVEMMRLFVIANSLLVFITMAWPNMQQVYTIVKDYITVVGWYSMGVWNMIDSYFKDRFDKYLREEYAKNPRMKKDLDNHRSNNRLDQIIDTIPNLIKGNNEKETENYNNNNDKSFITEDVLHCFKMNNENEYKNNPIDDSSNDCREARTSGANWDFPEFKRTDNGRKLLKNSPESTHFADSPITFEIDLGNCYTVTKDEYCPLDLNY
ncbi:hypothetical protein PV327_011272 [Microctonus hyperodae]|uniref:Uncharacterized protein n=1 Tax=Microctonus hyperodae TaxID=165561 RepID=A0AA39KRR1_MICHY|nr:hypothetical protein PV327_011272 [Microctonus hyperodae]